MDFIMISKIFLVNHYVDQTVTVYIVQADAIVYLGSILLQIDVKNVPMEVNMTQLQKHAITFVKGIKFIVHWDVYAQMVIIELMEYAVDAPIKEFMILTQKHVFVEMA